MTKQHAEINHRSIRPKFLTPKYQLEILRTHAERTKYTSRAFYTDILTGLTAKENTAEISKSLSDTPSWRNTLMHIHGWGDHRELSKRPVQPTIVIGVGEIVEKAVIALINKLRIYYLYQFIKLFSAFQ